jgi:SnoaL-like protein
MLRLTSAATGGQKVQVVEMTDGARDARGALSVSLAYYQAWTGKDFDRAMTFVADDIVCDTPGGKLQGAEAFRGFMEPFTRIVTRDELIAAFGDDGTAVLIYDTETVPVPHAPGAECHTVDNGMITHITIIFDRQPFTEARAASSPG